MSDGIFGPTHEPAGLLYDAFQAEALLREKREVGIWIEKERLAVRTAALDYAQRHGRPVPTLDQVKEQLAQGHIDYGAKWAYGVAELLSTAPASRGK
ncbi:hypothetical protein GCM10007320_66250 [Pseudorhodoferax aquiterrae]|uniref:Uncharacterized protein n=1 Tax=Pseudorhodoferax aquiterrae TaxID=747304 RepID=A0ABQ3GFZ1_9BURK|nr:hypothetical protein [Pseudorhodoferax aquiterrae]GHD04881.1 hypothetical protein GCM10007320_66250 [Pseudorhodoferax aquiterrae]